MGTLMYEWSAMAHMAMCACQLEDVLAEGNKHLPSLEKHATS